MSTDVHVSVDTSTRTLRAKRVHRRPPAKDTVDPIVEALHLLQRQATIRSALRRSPGAGVIAERELFLIRNQLARFPAAVQTITLTASELQRPVDTLSIRDLAKRC